MVPLVLGFKTDVARSTPVPVISARVVECDAVVQDAVCVVVAIDVVISLSSREVLDSGIELDPEEFVECDSLVVCVVVVLDVDWEELPAEVEDCVLLVDLVK